MVTSKDLGQSTPSVSPRAVKNARLEDLIDLCQHLMRERPTLPRKELEDLVDRALSAFPEWVDFREPALDRLERSK